MSYKKTVCIDFDGVINSYESGWDIEGGPASIPDGPVPGAFEALAKYVEIFDVIIFSTRTENPEARTAMYEWFRAHGMSEYVLSKLKIHDNERKPHAVLYIDDRGFQFEGIFPSVDFIDNYKPWNKR